MRLTTSVRTAEERRAPAASASTDVVDDRIIKGYPIVFNTLSEDLGGFRERILPQSVDRSLKADIRALVDHDARLVLGRTRSGTLGLKKDRHGMLANIEPDMEISYAKDTVRAVSRGDISGMSFGFYVIEENWHYEEGQTPIREILDMEISEISIVTWPAYIATSVDVAQRSLKRFLAEKGYDWRSKYHEMLRED